MLREALLPTPATLCALLLASCGGKVVFVDDDDGGAEAGFCESVDLDQSVAAQVCAVNDRCEMKGLLADGSTARIVCDDTPACLLFIDGLETCQCPSERIDWANTCPNGVPTCSGWTIDWTDPVFSCDE